MPCRDSRARLQYSPAESGRGVLGMILSPIFLLIAYHYFRKAKLAGDFLLF
jgi:hypothetical protein